MRDWYLLLMAGLCFAVVLLLGALWVSCTNAAEPPPGWSRDLRVEWGYTPPVEPVCTGFRLYQQGRATPVCTFAGGDTRAGDCAATIDRRTTAFTLTATFADNTESPHSAPFAFTDALPAPGVKTITLTQSITITQ